MKNLKNVSKKILTLLVKISKMCQKDCLHFSWLFSKIAKMCQQNVYTSRDFSQKSQKKCQENCLHFSWLFPIISNTCKKKWFTLLVTFRKNLETVSEKYLHFSWLFHLFMFPFFQFFKNASSFFSRNCFFTFLFDKHPQLSSQISLKIA